MYYTIVCHECIVFCSRHKRASDPLGQCFYRINTYAQTMKDTEEVECSSNIDDLVTGRWLTAFRELSYTLGGRHKLFGSCVWAASILIL